MCDVNPLCSAAERAGFRFPAGCSDAPDVQFIREGTLDKVNECRVRRPQLKVTVEPGRRGEDRPALRSPAAVRHEHWIAGPGRVVHEARAVALPVEFRHAFHGRPRLSAQRRHCPGADNDAAGAAQPANPECDERAVG